MISHRHALTLRLCIFVLATIVSDCMGQTTQCQMDSTTAYAEFLFNNGMYLNAATEYLRSFFYFNKENSEAQWNCFEKAVESYELANEVGVALRWWQYGERVCPNENTRKNEFRIRSARLLRKAGRLSEALEKLDEPPEGEANANQRSQLYFERALNHALVFDHITARKEFDFVIEPEPLKLYAKWLKEKIQPKDSLRHRSKTAAGIFATLPGLGYVYTGHYQTAVSALVVIGLFVSATAYSYDAGNPGVGALCGVLSFGWYSGSIYGSILSAERFNNYYLSQYISNFNN